MKRLVCLAKSKKWKATCVAGLEWDDSYAGDWIRPVGNRLSEAIEDEEMAYEGGGQVELLDVVEIEFLEPRPHACQVENHLIDADAWWEKVGTVSDRELRAMADEPDDIWGTDDSHHYFRDRVPKDEANQLDSSLMLVRLESARVMVKEFPERTAVRVAFDYKGVSYNLAATDPEFCARYRPQGEGWYPLADECYGCLSLGEPDRGYRYKLAAAVFEVG